MKKGRTFLIGMLLYAGLNLYGQAREDIPAISYIFLVDRSGSMKKDALIERVKGALDVFLSGCEDGSYILLKTFGSDIYDVWEGMLDESTRKILSDAINRIDAIDQWTWMSRAFRSLYEDVRRIKRIRKNISRIYVYIFTDGKNEPPPEAEEVPEEFGKILARYFPEDSLASFNTFIYYITLGVEAPEEIKTWSEKTENVRIEKTPERPPKDSIIPFIMEISLGKYRSKIDPRKTRIIKIPFTIDNLSRPSFPEIHVKAGRKDTVIKGLSQQTRKIVINYEIENTSYGTHTGKVVFTPGKGPSASINPSEFSVTYTVLKPLPLAVKILVIFVVLLGVSLSARRFYCAYFAFPLLGTIECKTPWGSKSFSFEKRKKCKKYELSKLLNISLPVRVYVTSGGLRKIKLLLSGIPRYVKVELNGMEKKGRKLKLFLSSGDVVKIGDVEITYKG